MGQVKFTADKKALSFAVLVHSSSLHDGSAEAI
jgi:hypothetical protein